MDKVTKANWVAESPDGTYLIVVGIEEQDSAALSDMAIWKINAADGSIAWQMTYGSAGQGSGLETAGFTSDGALIVGGFVEAPGGIGDMLFKSAGFVADAKPFIAKISAVDAAGLVSPSGFEWAHVEADTTYLGSTRAMRIDGGDNIFANVGSRTAVLKLSSSGAVIWSSGQIDSTFQSNDLELVPKDGGMILVGHQFGSTMAGCVGSGCSVVKGAMLKLDSSGALAWGPKLYGNYPGGVNQFAGLAAGDLALVYTECWGVTATYSSSGNSITGYALSCGTGIENCNNPEALSGGGYNAEVQAECASDPRVSWRALTIATDLDGNRVWSRMDSYQGGTASSHGSVQASAAEYLFPVSGGSLAFISDEATGFGFGVISVADGVKCYETLADVLPASEGSDSVEPFRTHADVKTEPHSPPTAPSRGALTSTDAIEVVVAELAGMETGGDTILSYHLEYDGGTAGSTWTELQGYTSNSLALSVVKTGLAVSTAYQVRYRTRNQFGWSSGYSSIASISTLTEPGQVELGSITAIIVGTNVEVAWSAPASNGSPLLAYEILFPTAAGAEPSAEDTSYCDGSLGAIVAATECTIPMS